MTHQFFADNSYSLVKKYLSKTIYKRLKNKTTFFGFTIDNAICSGISNSDSDIGIYAGDDESYDIFSEIFDLIITDYHSLTQHRYHATDLSCLNLSFTKPVLDPGNKYIVSTRIRVARNINGFPFTPAISAEQRFKVEQLVLIAIKQLPKSLKGQYFAIKTIIESKPETFKNNLFPKKGDRFQEAAGITREFPDARGVFLADNRNFMIWINEEDHLRIISLDHGSNLSETFNRLSLGLQSLNKSLNFSFNKKYGFLTACPSNLGTALRASVHIKLPNLSQRKNFLYNTAKQLKLQIRGTCGEKTSVRNKIFDISNKQRLGINEKSCLTTLHKGIEKIINLEKNYKQLIVK